MADRLEQLRETLRRDAGHYAPARPVLLCGDPATLRREALRADAPAWRWRLRRLIGRLTRG